MRKILTVLVLLAMFGMCKSSYGDYFLIYNVSTTIKGVNDVTPMSIPLKAYLLVKLADDDTFLDANMVWYGKDANTPKKVPVYIQIDSAGGTGALFGTSWSQGDYAVARLTGYGPEFRAVLTGKRTLKDVGFGTDPAQKKMVATSLKGVIMTYDIENNGFVLGPDLNQQFSGTGNISATLAVAWTKAVNDTEPIWTQDLIIEGQDVDGVQQGIKPTLERKGFQERISPF